VERRVATVFGGSGFIGRYLVRRLAAQGWIVRVAVRDAEAARFLMTCGDVGQVVPLETDVTEQAQVAAAARDATVVINLVGILYERGRRTFQRMHVETARSIAEVAAAAGAERLVQVSAIGADPGSPAEYGRTKAAGEQAVAEAFPGATIVRPSVVFGPEDGFFNRFAQLARIMPALPVFDMRMQPVYVADVADGIVRILERPSTAGQKYEFGGPRVISFRELMEMLLKETCRKRLLLPMPLGLAEFEAFFAELLPVPPLTRDQVKLLSRDNVVADGALGLRDLGIEPTSVEVVIPTYLARFRPQVKLRRRS